MTFSDPHVRRLLNRRFVCAWTNTQGDPNAGASFAHGPKEPAGGCLRGNGEHNIQLIVMTPKGRIFHVISGFISPRELRKQLAFALRNYGKDEEQLVAAHRARIETIEAKTFDGPMGGWAKRATLRDHRFMVEHPLLDSASFKPAMLVGNSQTFFGSRSGTGSGERIGEGPNSGRLKEFMDEILKKQKEKREGK